MTTLSLFAWILAGKRRNLKSEAVKLKNDEKTTSQDKFSSNGIKTYLELYTEMQYLSFLFPCR